MAHTPPCLQDLLDSGNHPGLLDWLARGRHLVDSAITPAWRGPVSANLGRDLATVYARLHGFTFPQTVRAVFHTLITHTGRFCSQEAFCTALLLHGKNNTTLTPQEGMELLRHIHYFNVYRRHHTPRYAFFGHLGDCVARALPQEQALDFLQESINPAVGSANLSHIGAHLSIYGLDSVTGLVAMMRKGAAQRVSYLRRSSEEHLLDLLSTGSAHRLLVLRKCLRPRLEAYRPYAPHIVTHHLVRVALAV